MTKTEAGTRDIPMGADPARDAARLARPLPAPRRRAPPRLPGSWSAAALAEAAARRRRSAALSELPQRYWEPVFKRLGLPYVTPHSARHSFISTLQAQGIEVGLVAKIAGHANPTVTLATTRRRCEEERRPSRRWSGPMRLAEGGHAPSGYGEALRTGVSTGRC